MSVPSKSLALALLLGIVAFATGAPAAEFRIGQLNTANYLTLARDSGRIADAVMKLGGTVTWAGPFAAFAPAQEAAAAGRIDATSSGLASVVFLAAQKANLVAFALEKYSGRSQGIVAAPNSGVTSLRDLQGRKVALSGRGGTGEYLLLRAFERNGLDVSRVERLYLSPQDGGAAFASGQVAAWATWDQYFATAQNMPGARVLTTGDRIDSYNWSVHLVTREFLAKNPRVVRATYEALVAEAAAAQGKPEAIGNAYRKLGVPESIARTIEGFDVPVIEPFDAKGQAALRELGEQLARFGIVPNVPDISRQFVDATKL